MPAVPSRPLLAVVVDERDWVGRALGLVLAEEGYATLRARTAEQAVTLCESASPDVVFIEQRLSTSDARGHDSVTPETGGLALCRRLRGDGIVSDAVPIVVTSADGVRRDDVLAALRAGAWELCAFPTDAAALGARCAVWVRAKRHADRVAELGAVDPATGLYNLRGLLRRAGEVAQLGARAACVSPGAPPLACVAFTVEAGAAPLADGIGHELAARVREACAGVGRGSDVVARIGARDFAILAPGATGAGGERMLDRLRGTLAQAAGPLPSGERLRVRGVVRAADGGVQTSADAVQLVAGAVTALHAGGAPV